MQERFPGAEWLSPRSVCRGLQISLRQHRSLMPRGRVTMYSFISFCFVFKTMEPLKMQGPGKGPSSSGLRMVPNIASCYSQEMASFVFYAKKQMLPKNWTTVLDRRCPRTCAPRGCPQGSSVQFRDVSAVCTAGEVRAESGQYACPSRTS